MLSKISFGLYLNMQCKRRVLKLIRNVYIHETVLQVVALGPKFSTQFFQIEIVKRITFKILKQIVLKSGSIIFP